MRSAGRIDTIVEFPAEDRAEANRQRVSLERRHINDPDVEVVVLGGDSLEALALTHGRYFKTTKEILAG